MKKVLKITLVIFIIILIKLIITFTINEILISNYNNGINKEELIPILKKLNTNEPYIVYYNEANIKYNEKNYQESLEGYNKSLSKNPPQKKICNIRINKTLTLIKLIDSNDKQTVLEKLEEARNNLYEDGCANPNDNSGKSMEAEELEEKIKEMEEELNNNNNSSTANNQQEEKNEEETEEEQNLEKELEEIRKNATTNRNQELDDLQNSNDFSYYSGKRW